MDFAPTSTLIAIAFGAPLAFALLWWIGRRSLHPMSDGRRRALLAVRIGLVLLAALALMRPAVQAPAEREAVVFVLDHSRSQGESGMRRGYAIANRLASSVPSGTPVGFVSAGSRPLLLRRPMVGGEPLTPDFAMMEQGGGATNYQAAIELARGLFPPGTSRRIVIVGDGMQTHGDLSLAASEAAHAGIVIDASASAGEARRDVRVLAVTPSRSSLHENAEVALTARVESSMDGEGVVRLFEDGVEVDRQAVALNNGEAKSIRFTRAPDRRKLYKYRVVVDGFEGDAIPDNNEAITFVEVSGQPLFLYVEGESEQAGYLAGAMQQEGVNLEVRPAAGIPNSIEELVGYDGLILSDVPARDVGNERMQLIREYVEFYGGGFLMVGGKNSFGVGNYYRTPIEEILPVKMKSPDKEEKYAVALCLVIDRSGSMSGSKIEICKSAARGTVELLGAKDYLGVVCFDSSANWVVPLTRIADTSKAAIDGQIATINAGGGTNIYPGMSAGRAALTEARAKVKHMIVLTDGQTEGGGYQQLAAQMHSEGVTISTVAVGSGADTALLQSIAAAGGGSYYFTADPSQIPQIFTQDTMVHAGRLIREEPFAPSESERHSMLAGWPVSQAPPLLGYVKTRRRPNTQVPLVTDQGDPLLARWQFGLGKVMAFTSDCKARWSEAWIKTWGEGYNQFWAQVLRDLARQQQGNRMELRVHREGEAARIVVDVLADAATYRNLASVEAEVSFVPAHARVREPEPSRVTLRQVAPGRYEGRFQPDQPGVYLVRASSGGDSVSAGLVQRISGEAATGQVDEALIAKVTSMTGGSRLAADAGALPRYELRSRSNYIELRPWFIAALLALFLVDVVIRRWENVLGMAEFGKSVAGLSKG